MMSLHPILAGLQAIVALLMIFFLPGFTLIRMLFPRKGELDRELDLLYQITLGIGMSIVITILDMFFLNTLGVGPEGFGYITAPNVWLSLIALTLIFFAVGWYRGAYPFLGKLHPALKRLPKEEMEEVTVLDEKIADKLHELARARQKCRWELKECERKVGIAPESMRRHYEKKLEDTRKKMDELNAEMKKLEEKQAKLLYKKK